MPKSAWEQLLAGAPWFHGEGRFPITAYSEFLPPPRLVCMPYQGRYLNFPIEEDPWGWHVTEYEETFQLRPGLDQVAHQIVTALVKLAHDRPAHGISKNKLKDNPYWPPGLARQASALRHERFVVLLPLALSRTQDDKGRVRWTLFGGSEQGPARAFWQGFFTAPGQELPEDQSLGFLRRLLNEVYGEPSARLVNLFRSGFRILPCGEDRDHPHWREEPWPSWARLYFLNETQSLRDVKFLLTFRPFAKLPAPIQRAYLDGLLHLLPCPASLVFWGAQTFHWLERELPLAMQIPLLHSVARHTHPRGLRVPQSGWMHEPRPDHPEPGDNYGPVRNTYKRTHRWARVHRHEDDLSIPSRDEKVAHVLFSARPEDVGLYGKPTAHNAQVWTHDHHLLLDGPNASAADIRKATRAIEEGGLFGYRFHYPAMRVGKHEVYWHRPLVAYQSPRTKEPVVVSDGPLGYLTAYRVGRPDLERPIELWPRLLQRDDHLAAVRLFDHVSDLHQYQTVLNVRKLLDTEELFDFQPLPESFARQLLTLPKEETLDGWLESLPQRAKDPERARHLAIDLRKGIESEDEEESNGRGSHRLPKALTYHQTARRPFEVAYWNTIAALSEGKYVNKDNADCVLDPPTQAVLTHHHRDLEALGDYLLDYYRQQIAEAKMTGKVLAGELPFQWRTDFDFSWMGGWRNNQEGHTYERDLLVMIPGKDRKRAVIMADHYDTAYMADHYEKEYGGNGARLAASGADDNHSATASLMLGAPVFMELSRQGKLACDVWLIHLTGEEFPADCMGARHLCQKLVEGNLQLHLPRGAPRDLGKVRIQGVYVLDMVAHNNDHERDVFQIAPGTGPESMWLAYQAHLANAIWNAQTEVWNKKPARKGKPRGKRSVDGATIPKVARHPRLSGEVRPPSDPRSTLYNTDGQIFSDAGVPVVLFMENYDINRTGYHDSHDTMENIDLDYGSAVAAIAIESVARAASTEPPRRAGEENRKLQANIRARKTK